MCDAKNTVPSGSGNGVYLWSEEAVVCPLNCQWWRAYRLTLMPCSTKFSAMVACARSFSLACVSVCQRLSTYVYASVCFCVFVCAFVCACVRACMRACVRACVRACMRVCVRACVHACMREYVRVCVMCLRLRVCVCVCVSVSVCFCVSIFFWMCVRACVRA